MADRCDTTDLLVDQCGGTCCRPDLSKPSLPVAVARFTAAFDSHCMQCGGAMFEGDQIARTEDGSYVHDDCATDGDNLGWHR